jgi:hypothetical protein
MQIRESLTYAILVHFIGIVFLISISARHTMTQKFYTRVSLITEQSHVKGEEAILRDDLRASRGESMPAPGPEREEPMQEGPPSVEVASVSKEVLSESKLLQPVPEQSEALSYAYSEHDLASKAHERFIIMNTDAFVQDAGFVIDSFINVAVQKSLTKGIKALTAQVNLHYGQTGAVTDIDIYSEDPDLMSLLAALNWRAVPLPASYMLGFKVLVVRVMIMDGVPRLTVTAI